MLQSSILVLKDVWLMLNASFNKRCTTLLLVALNLFLLYVHCIA